VIKNIIFDLGHVLVNVDYSNFRNKLEADGVKEELYNSFFTGGAYRNIGYEAGRIDTRQFIEKCVNELGLKMSGSEFADAFNIMFAEIKPMSSLLRNLKAEGKHKLYLLSNTSPLHFEYIKTGYDYINLLDDFALSYKLKSLKPEPEIYLKAMDLFKSKPEESVFIDDLIENCQGAEKVGIKSIQYDLKKHDKFEKEFDLRLRSE
jgi:HAD superfamily hydrolase (TIGR01509 family)